MAKKEKKVVDVEELRRITEINRKRREFKAKNDRQKEEEIWDIKADVIVDQYIAGLLSRMETESRKGNDSVDVYLPDERQLRTRVESRLSRWCYNNGLHTSTKKVHLSDDDLGTYVLTISWAKK